MRYNARIILNGKVIYTQEVEAESESSAMEAVYDFFEQESYAEVEVDSDK